MSPPPVTGGERAGVHTSRQTAPSPGSKSSTFICRKRFLKETWHMDTETHTHSDPVKVTSPEQRSQENRLVYSAVSSPSLQRCDELIPLKHVWPAWLLLSTSPYQSLCVHPGLSALLRSLHLLHMPPTVTALLPVQLTSQSAAGAVCGFHSP